jgi:hypothetical protein
VSPRTGSAGILPALSFLRRPALQLRHTTLPAQTFRKSSDNSVFVRARLQPCHNRCRINKALAAEGGLGRSAQRLLRPDDRLLFRTCHRLNNRSTKKRAAPAKSAECGPFSQVNRPLTCVSWCRRAPAYRGGPPGPAMHANQPRRRGCFSALHRGPRRICRRLRVRS